MLPRTEELLDTIWKSLVGTKSNWVTGCNYVHTVTFPIIGRGNGCNGDMVEATCIANVAGGFATKYFSGVSVRPAQANSVATESESRRTYVISAADAEKVAMNKWRKGKRGHKSQP